MKNIFKKIMSVLGLLFIVTACSDFDEINTNPDGITTATPQMLATKLLLNITRDNFGQEKSFMGNFMIDKYILWSEFPQAEQYNDLGRASFGRMTRLIDADKMVELSKDLSPEAQNSYKALRHFFRAYTFFNLSMRVGDIPYSQALNGESEGVTKPAYDTQKEVFLGILNELDEADTLFANGGDINGDIIYGGDLEKWRKAVNSLALKILINLYKKVDDNELDVIGRFNEILSNRPVFESNDDNFSLTYSNQQGQMYPFFKDGNQFVIYPMVSSILIDKLKELNDRRLFYYTEPSPVKLENGFLDNEYEAYVGVDPSIVYSDLSEISSSRDYSDINDRYKEYPQGEPIYILSYAELQFILAEAAIREWITEDANIFYQNGIEASFKYVDTHTPEERSLFHNMEINDAYINDYINSPEVKLEGTTNNRIGQVITQKYITTFLQSPLNAFFEQRRTGFPDFPVNPNTNENVPSELLPIRWMYPSDEVDYNADNWNEAVSRQYSGNDNNNGIMWILKN